MDKPHLALAGHQRHKATRQPHWRLRAACVALSIVPLMLAAGGSHAATAAELLDSYSHAAGQAPSAARGQAFFTATHGKTWSCSSCHGPTPEQPGRHAVTGKAIAPLAPSAHAPRFTDAAKTEKWFRRNCGDVLGRECSAAEKADVITWLASLQASK